MIGIIFLFSAGYAAFSSNFLVSGKGTIVEKPITIEELKDKKIDTGDGLYIDQAEENRYVYRGENPDNYISFNNEMWRIIGIESDGSLKIIKNEIVRNIEFDVANHRSTTKNTYCLTQDRGCNVYSQVVGNFMPPDKKYSGTVTEDSTIKEYLNNSYFDTLNTDSKNQLISHNFNIGAVEFLNQNGGDTLEKNVNSEKMYKWNGYVGLVNVSDIIKASKNVACKSVTDDRSQSTDNNGKVCNDSYFFSDSNTTWWTINPAATESEQTTHSVWGVYDFSNNGGLGRYYSNLTTIGVRPVLYLNSNTKFIGKGTESKPYLIVN